MNVEEASPIPGLEALPRERLPPHDLWAGIESRIKPAAVAPRRRPAWPYALAASLVTAVLTGALLSGPAPGPDTSTAAAPGPLAAVTAASPAYRRSREAERLVEGISSRTLRTLRSESLDNLPALVAQRAESNGQGNGLMKASLPRGEARHSQEALLRANLKLVKQAEREVRRALRQDPGSETLQDLLASAESQRAQLTALLVHEQD